jgi:hypothetical protein
VSTPAATELPKSRWLVRGAVYGLLGGALNGIIAALLFGPGLVREDAAFDAVTDVMLTTARAGVQIGLFYGVVFGALAWWLVGTAHRPRRVVALALGVQAPLNILFALGLASMWTFVSLIVTPALLTLAGVSVLLSLDARRLATTPTAG